MTGDRAGARTAGPGGGESPLAGAVREPVPEAETRVAGAREELDRRAPAGPAEARAQLRGRITDTHGRALAGARIHVESPTESHELESDADGRFVQELASIPEAEPVTLQVVRESYLPRTLRLDPALPALVELQALPVLVGRVLDVERRPLAPPGYVKADVLDAVTLEMRRSEVELGEGGSYRLEGLPLGRLVRVEARARGFAARSVPLDRVLAPDETAEIDVELERGAVISGTVLDARTRAPLPGASVWMEAFEPAEGSVHPTARAGEDGRFRLEGANVEVSIQDGERCVFFWLVAEAEGHAASPTRAYGARANEAHVYDFEMLLEPSECSLDIAARLEDGRPARGATVWAIDAQGNPTFANADEEGKYGFENVPAGPFALWLSFQETRSVSTSAGAPIELSLGLHVLRADLELEAGQSRKEELVLRPPGSASLEGRVVDVEGRAVPGFAVRAQLNFQLGGLMLASGWDETRTDAEGRYRFGGLHPGKYQVWASGEGTALACAQPAHTYVDVAAGQRTEVDALAVGGCMTIEGTVERGEHDLAALALEVRDPVTGAVRAATSPALDGLFRFEPLIAREYELVLLREGVVLDRTTVGPGSASAIFLRAR